VNPISRIRSTISVNDIPPHRHSNQLSRLDCPFWSIWKTVPLVNHRIRMSERCCRIWREVGVTDSIEKIRQFEWKLTNHSQRTFNQIVQRNPPNQIVVYFRAVIENSLSHSNECQPSNHRYASTKFALQKTLNRSGWHYFLWSRILNLVWSKSWLDRQPSQRRIVTGRSLYSKSDHEIEYIGWSARKCPRKEQKPSP
jgi:hypothetical protein